ncbi:MAG: hypothetical protein QW507_01955 [Candidatus Nanoarchaeia archaeon]|nr:hypothetical protein [Candidatus Haiyanarchaeum thermophilum]MCW1302822.1 hypothetical protein [Candidatus Haiyanarchaeum thermophilum]MCW1303503.1 hypothetical protein [Candidatus Haiyanarchaeum thermophilum]MCW1306683.1 hypothetical protein [Candidatus Haiyanarchaeum thermophilum]MCW1307361.1 hypothetical protein [Candidatus Haiyanarchaeum thermophilum]
MLSRSFSLIILFLILSYFIQFSAFLIQLRPNYVLSFLIFLVPFLLLFKRMKWSYYSACALLVDTSFFSFLAAISELINVQPSISYNITSEGISIMFFGSDTLLRIMGYIAMILIYMLSLLILLRHKSELVTVEKMELERYVKCPLCGELAPLIEAYKKYFCMECKKLIEPPGRRNSWLKPLLFGILISFVHFLLLSI